MDILSELNFIDLLIILALAGGAFAGFTQGMIRYVLGWAAVVIAFIVAAQLKGPMTEVLGFWRAFTPELREFYIFIVLFIGLTIAGWFIVRAFYKTTRLPIVKQLDEIGGAILGVAFAATFIILQLIVFDSLFRGNVVGEGVIPGQTAGLRGYYDAMNDSVLIEFFRSTIIPAVGFIARPFVPEEISRFLHWP
ncbi:MAG TPA: CvpA family protein [Candidatus Limnocylindria bacterium]|nr:CvpA family protein [Candidatus Limnocylindria bacterium]